MRVCGALTLKILVFICAALVYGVHMYAAGLEEKGLRGRLAQVMGGKARVQMEDKVSVQTPIAGIMPHGNHTGTPAHVFVFMHPKTGSGSVWNAVSKTGLVRRPRTHFPFKHNGADFVKGFGCNRHAWCLVVSAVRKVGRAMISRFFQSNCGWSSPAAKCRKNVLELDDAELAEAIVEFAQRIFRKNYPHWWSMTHKTLRDAGLPLDMRNIGRDGFASSHNGLWLVLRFEEVGDYERILKKWLPGIAVKNARPTTAKVYHPQYSRMMKHFANMSSWPSALLSQMQASESMRIFYPGESIM
mmetsp:Transcript_20291/g.57081  ORF Transcript_20291/g.57081 Transcript_20291/m.57081 type:complete len:300 (+) Transcript_20291:95-994(+)